MLGNSIYRFDGLRHRLPLSRCERGEVILIAHRRQAREETRRIVPQGGDDPGQQSESRNRPISLPFARAADVRSDPVRQIPLK